MKKIILSILVCFLLTNLAFADSFSSGVSAYNSQNYINALKHFQSAVKEDPFNSSARYYLAITYVKNKKPAEAIKEYNFILRTDPGSDAARLASAGLNLLQNSSGSVNKITIPIEKNTTSIVVRNILFNNKTSANLILDTGATNTLISHSLARQLGLNTAAAPKITMLTVNGKVQAPMVNIDSIKINGLEARNIKVVVHDIGDSGTSGLLGMSFLNHFKMTMDRNNGMLTLEK